MADRRLKLPDFPRLAGANLGDRLGAGLAAVLGIALAASVSSLVPTGATGLMMVAPIGASAVLVFAVPASPLAQPWSVLGGNIISALVGMMAAALVPVPALAAGVAVGGAIIAMSLLRCLHPPGGAMALTVVLGSPWLAAMGPWFPLLPVGVNSLALVLAAWAWHRVSGHSYPHRPPPAARRGAAVPPRGYGQGRGRHGRGLRRRTRGSRCAAAARRSACQGAHAAPPAQMISRRAAPATPRWRPRRRCRRAGCAAPG